MSCKAGDLLCMQCLKQQSDIGYFLTKIFECLNNFGFIWTKFNYRNIEYDFRTS